MNNNQNNQQANRTGQPSQNPAGSSTQQQGLKDKNKPGSSSTGSNYGSSSDTNR
ncbi:MAG: hypothetical protein WDN72_04420 [Alphaproteobacteria bacterium]